MPNPLCNLSRGHCGSVISFAFSVQQVPQSVQTHPARSLPPLTSLNHAIVHFHAYTHSNSVVHSLSLTLLLTSLFHTLGHSFTLTPILSSQRLALPAGSECTPFHYAPKLQTAAPAGTLRSMLRNATPPFTSTRAPGSAHGAKSSLCALSVVPVAKIQCVTLAAPATKHSCPPRIIAIATLPNQSHMLSHTQK